MLLQLTPHRSSLPSSISNIQPTERSSLLFSSLLFERKIHPAKMQPQKLLTLMAFLAIGAQALPANAQSGKFHLTPSN
jgi:hypothetical protein